MKIPTATALLLLLCTPAWSEEPVLIDKITDNLTITRSVRFKPGSYLVRDAEGDGVIKVGADNLTIDLAGVVLRGAKIGLAKDRYVGVGLAIDGHKNVIVKNARIGGYQYNIRVSDSSEIRLEDCVVGDSRAERISRGGEPINVWLGLRSMASWRRYGAAIWIERSRAVLVTRCKAHGAQNGLLLIETSGCRIQHNDFSFNSGWGIGLWRSSNNEVFWNLLDFVGRPWAGSIGADAASLVVVNRSHKNWFIGNSMSHSGDGFFLTNANDYGKGKPRGPSEDNVVALNDGSYSPHNAFEGTFSQRNSYVRNRANRSHYGFWLGFSSRSLVLENEVSHNTGDGVAIDSASRLVVVGNKLIGNRGSAIALWVPSSRAARFPLRDAIVRNNTIRGSRSALRLSNTTQVRVSDNKISECGPARGKPDNVAGETKFSAADFWRSATGKRIARLQTQLPQKIKLYPSDARMPQGLFWYEFSDWAPIDFRQRSVLFARDATGATHLWMFGSLRPAAKQTGFVLQATGNPRHYLIQGAPGADQAGGRRNLGLRVQNRTGQQFIVPFEFDQLSWQVRYHKLPQFPLTDETRWKALFAAKPEAVINQAKLADRWLGKQRVGWRWALAATTRYRFPKGTYQFVSYSDDGIRLAVDGKRIIDNWTHHGGTRDTAKIRLDGVHQVTVHYFQNGGGSALRVGWSRTGN